MTDFWLTFTYYCPEHILWSNIYFNLKKNTLRQIIVCWFYIFWGSVGVLTEHSDAILTAVKEQTSGSTVDNCSKIPVFPWLGKFSYCTLISGWRSLFLSLWQSFVKPADSRYDSSWGLICAYTGVYCTCSGPLGGDCGSEMKKRVVHKSV